ncbi:carbohydrate binding family 9 domain-containing protein [Anaerobaca lacustris]|uniref:DUF5916 domain-containing protein n=1 Tax=Anaerobaca lacustris TaxID=3044600 RepID=A0AAW6TTR6_9BACT|nr:DUF5916 domain-containing protein [Sedimentisphaerales bacterium M17dextr]
MRTGIARSLVGVCMVCSAVLLAIAIPADAHNDPNASVPSLRALKVDSPIVVDGVLDEPFWQDAEVATDFIDTRSGQPAAQQTLVRIAYSRTHLHIAVECLDDRIDLIRASERREDRQFQGDDWLEVHLDPLHSHNAKYAFFSNPLGVRVDAAEGPSGAFSTSWTAEWDLAARIGDDRWVFEMSIPLRVLNYRRADGQIWGLNFTRYLVRTDTTSFWSFSPTDSYKPRHFGHLVGLDLADSEFSRNLEITPYVSSRTDFNGHGSTELQTGGDVSFRLTPSIVTSWTINPDFAQVEADADTIELRDTERFLPEKRLFFREGEDLFASGANRLYYSRRLTDIDGGARVSGEMNDYRFALVDVYGDVVHGDPYYGNSSVFRLLRNVGEKSNVGLHASSSDFKQGHSRVLGSDGKLFVNDDWSFNYLVAGADDRLEEGVERSARDRSDYLGYGSVVYKKYPWEVGANYRGISEGFDPVLGFIPRRDIYGPTVYSMYSLRASDRWYKRLFAYFGIEYFENGDGQTSLRDYSADASVTLKNDVRLGIEYDRDYHRPYHNERTELDVVFDATDFWRSTAFEWAFGVFEETEYDELSLGKHFKPIDRWPIRYDYVIRFEDRPDGDRETIWLNRIVFDYFFTDVMWLKSAIQHRSTEVHNISVIYGWEFVKDAHLYLVYNGVREDDDPETIHSLFAKLAYTLR